MPGWIGPWEILLLLLVALLIFGPKRLPEMGRSLGRGARELKKALTSAGERDGDRESWTDAFTADDDEAASVREHDHDSITR